MAERQGKRRGRARVPRVGRLWILLVLGVVVFLYYRPLATWHDARTELARREADVLALRAEKARLEQRLTRAESVEALGREARGLGYVRPGERLFIVKGIAQWQRRHGVR